MSSNNGERKKKMSYRQLETMIMFMEKHLDFARGKLKRTESDALWNSLQKTLHTVADGPKKDVKQWKRSWYYQKRCVKKEARELCNQQRLCVNEVLKIKGMDDLHYRILKIIGQNEIFADNNNEQLSGEESDAESDTSPIVTRSVSRASGDIKSNRKLAKSNGDKQTDHFVSYVTDRLNEIKNAKKRQILEDEIIDLIRRVSLEDK